jgi:hypothetical protein
MTSDYRTQEDHHDLEAVKTAMKEQGAISSYRKL